MEYRQLKADLNTCPCGSGKKPWVENDARGIPIGWVCDDCVDKKKNKYRKDIFTNPNYETDEPIEPEEDTPY